MGLIADAVAKYSPLQLGLELLSDLLADYPKRNVQVRLWDGSSVGSNQPHVVVILKNPSALRAMFLLPSELTLGESYIFGSLAQSVGNSRIKSQRQDRSRAQKTKSAPGIVVFFDPRPPLGILTKNMD
jgi:hypothetical protein